MYQLARDFAGSAATIIAATVAVLVTLFLGKGQQRIAKQQARTARDQLRYNLFEKRYAIYEAARKAIDIAFEKRNEDTMPRELEELFINFDEAQFFFHKSENIHSFLEQLRKDIREFLTKNYLFRKRTAEHQNSQNVAMRKQLLDEEAEILKLNEALYLTQKNLPQTFGDALAFPRG